MSVSISKLSSSSNQEVHAFSLCGCHLTMAQNLETASANLPSAILSTEGTPVVQKVDAETSTPKSKNFTSLKNFGVKLNA